MNTGQTLTSGSALWNRLLGKRRLPCRLASHMSWCDRNRILCQFNTVIQIVFYHILPPVNIPLLTFLYFLPVILTDLLLVLKYSLHLLGKTSRSSVTLMVGGGVEFFQLWLCFYSSWGSINRHTSLEVALSLCNIIHTTREWLLILVQYPVLYGCNQAQTALLWLSQADCVKIDFCQGTENCSKSKFS